MPMYTSSYLKPDGTPYMIPGPAGASPKDVDERVLLRHPEARKASEMPKKPEPESGEALGLGGALSGMDSEAQKRVLGKVGVPGLKDMTATERIVGGAMAIPGEGLLMGVLRPALAAGGTALATKGDLWETGKAAAQALGGTMVGGVARAGARQIGAALDKTIPEVMKLVNRVLPEAAGSTPAETVNKIVGGEALRDVGRDFGKMQKGLWDKYVNPNRLPGYVYPKELTDADKQLLNDSVQRLGTMEERAGWQAMNRKYYVADGITEWFKSALSKGLVPGTGKHDVRALQEALIPMRARVKDVLPGVEGPLRMPAESAAMDIPAKSPYVAAHMGMGLPHLRVGVPHAARLSEEGMTPELAAQAARQLGAYGLGQAIPSQQP